MLGSIIMHRIILSILLASAYFTTLTCSCNYIKKLEEFRTEIFERSNLIFVGETVESNEDGTYKLRLVELFKGSVKDSIIVGNARSYCSLFPQHGEIWLIYIDQYENEHIDIQDCGLSRRFDFPYFFSMEYEFPVPPHPRILNDVDKLIQHEKRNLESHNVALKLLEEEIILLRQRAKRKN